jgi:adenosylcobinamide-phosphate synthase
VGLAGVVGMAWSVDRVIGRRIPAGMQGVVRGLLLKQMLSLRLLLTEVRDVEAALARSEQEGRRRVSRIVSRDTGRLSTVEIRESALESLAENFVDSLVAPIWWYLVAGLPGAVAYRYINTADAMWGYRGEMEWPGKVAAVADDVANFVPARFTGIMMALPSVRPSELRVEARKAPSPNGGWPMAALALRLGVRLSKPGVYVFNPSGRAPQPEDTHRALAMTSRWAAAWFALAGIVERVLGHGR